MGPLVGTDASTDHAQRHTIELEERTLRLQSHTSRPEDQQDLSIVMRAGRLDQTYKRTTTCPGSSLPASTPPPVSYTQDLELSSSSSLALTRTVVAGLVLPWSIWTA